MSIIMHSFNSVEIPQLETDEVIVGTLIPKGYVNATEMYKAAKQQVDTEDFEEIAFWLHRNLLSHLTYDFSFYVIESDDIWVHPLIAVDFICKVEQKFNYYVCCLLAIQLNATEAPEKELLLSNWMNNMKFRITGLELIHQAITGGVESTNSFQEITGYLKGVAECKYNLEVKEMRVLVSFSKETFFELLSKAKIIIKEKPKTCVYFFSNSVNNIIKIGYSSNWERRLRELEASSGLSLDVLAIVDGGRELEQSYHVIFNKDRVKGEWFKETKQLLDFIKSL